MKLCIPIKENNGLKSEVYSHFGSAPAFLIFDTNSNEMITIDNSNLNHVHGECNPMKLLENKNVDVVIVGGIGGGAISKLNANNIKVFQSVYGTVQLNIDLFNKSSLPELAMEHACTQHNHHH